MQTSFLSQSVNVAARECEDASSLLDRAGSVDTHGKGKILVREGMLTPALFRLESGWAYRYVTTHDGARQILAILLPGDFCNLDVLSISRSNYSVELLTDAKISSFLRSDVIHLFDNQPTLVSAHRRMMAIEYSTLGRWALCLGRRSARERLAHFLCEIAFRVGASNPTGESAFNVPLTQEQKGDILGLTSVHVNRVLQRLKSDGLIKRTGRLISIPDFAALATVGDFQSDYLHVEGMRPTGDIPLTVGQVEGDRDDD